MKNKGFSLVELIIVIAIMAILAAAIAPALIRYIDKSRRADDVAAAESINTAVSAALANEDAYSQVAKKMTGGVILTSAASTKGSDQTFPTSTYDVFATEINSSLGNQVPALKYTKDSAAYWSVGVSEAGKPIVWLGTSSGGTTWEMQPDICASYK
jgi:type IV pilus assembly protein PilA